MRESRVEQASELMSRFAVRTGITSDRPPRRYLWTDAFAVCNFLGLSAATGDGRWLELALRLVDQVHHVLGCHRPGDTRTGWISGLGPTDGEAHPTRGGLRIGKPLPEREPRAPIDERLEWERDGQYFHYLTKWIHALDQVARATRTATFNEWARELAEAAYRAFVYAPPGGGRKRMYWKASVDLSRPQVASMGQHDPLDGWVTCVQLEATAGRLAARAHTPHLGEAAADFAAMVDPSRLATADPLGIGGLLVDARRVEQLMLGDAWPRDDGLLDALLAAARIGLEQFVAQPDLRLPAGRRLAFRELGLALGLDGLGAMAEDTRRSPERFPRGAHARLQELSRYAPVRTAIESLWLAPASRLEATWRDHEDINDVMLATSLLPEGFLVLTPIH